ncbi:anti-sigma regulatory factor (Ser/Thr protein kinase) [Allocatelliglobosispora scoriae]|uniref:Anti-sigma regulatory factor (Ser/Thr protein kinase) n=1 Tax=Allocatelliglobosispora scoriae TaxID=643052 RepID=A0A841BLL5_9ACTN|nr:anti-sigma regulatory factor (Ser/Thr protein kinase) [Allocatelliglobosispora scoriae]
MRGTLDHPALFYRGRDALVASLIPFIKAGLAEGEPVLAALPPANLAALRLAMGPEEIPGLRFADMSVAGRNPGRILPLVLDAFVQEAGDRRARIIGEPIWADRTDLEYPACFEHEMLINLALTGQDVTVLCPYDLDSLQPDRIADAELTHPTLLDARGVVRRSARYPHDDEASLLFDQQLPKPPAVAISLAFDGDGLREVRRLITDLGIAADNLAMLQIAVSELSINAIEHGGGSGVLRVWREESYVVGEVESPRLLHNVLAGRLLADPHSLSGRGLLLLNGLCDLVRVQTGSDGTLIRFWLPVAGPDSVEPGPDLD